jgi:hypothetical protein
MLKVALPVAVVVLIAVIWFTFWLGKEAGKKINAYAASKKSGQINPDLHDELGDFVDDLLASTSNPDKFVMMPDDLKKRGEELNARVRTARRARR